MAKADVVETPRRMIRPAAPAKPAEPAEPAQPEPPPTPEQLQKMQTGMFKSMFGRDPQPNELPAADTPAQEPPPTAEPPAQPGTPTPTAAPAATPTPTPPATPATPAPTQPDPEAVARRTAELVVDRIKQPGAPQTTTSPAAPSEVVPDFTLSPDDKKDWEVVQFLVRTEPAKYAGRDRKFIDYLKAYYAYQDKWSAEHKDEDFDPDDEEHARWFSANDPSFTEEELDAGREAMIEDRVYQKRVKPELDKLNRERAIQAHTPTIDSNVRSCVLSFLVAVDENMAKHVTSPDGRPMFTDDAMKKLAAASPIGSRIVERYIRGDLLPLVMELEMSVVPGAAFDLDPSKQLHADILDYTNKAEQAMASKNEARSGRKFVTRREMERIPKADRDGYYVVSVDDVEEEIVRELSTEAKKTIEAEREIAKREFGSSNPVVQPTEPAPPQPPQPQTRENGSKPKPPSLGGGGETVRTSDMPAPGTKSFGEKMAATMFKGSV